MRTLVGFMLLLWAAQAVASEPDNPFEAVKTRASDALALLSGSDNPFTPVKHDMGDDRASLSDSSNPFEPVSPDSRAQSNPKKVSSKKEPAAKKPLCRPCNSCHSCNGGGCFNRCGTCGPCYGSRCGTGCGSCSGRSCYGGICGSGYPLKPYCIPHTPMVPSNLGPIVLSKRK